MSSNHEVVSNTMNNAKCCKIYDEIWFIGWDKISAARAGN